MKAPKTGDKSPTKAHKAFTTAHLINTISTQLGHTKRHYKQLGKDKNAKAKALDYNHTGSHLDGGVEHAQKLIDHIKTNYPAEAKEFAKLQEDTPKMDLSKRISAAHRAVKK